MTENVVLANEDIEIISHEDDVEVLFKAGSDIQVDVLPGVPGARGPEGNKYELAFALQGRPLSGEIWPRYVFSTTVTFPAGATDSYASARVAATGTPEFSCQKNGVEFAKITFSGTNGVFTQVAPVTFAPGDVFTLVSPVTRDDTIEDVSITFAGLR